jgi:hypothetical protein
MAIYISERNQRNFLHRTIKHLILILQNCEYPNGMHNLINPTFDIIASKIRTFPAKITSSQVACFFYYYLLFTDNARETISVILSHYGLRIPTVDNPVSKQERDDAIIYVLAKQKEFINFGYKHKEEELLIAQQLERERVERELVERERQEKLALIDEQNPKKFVFVPNPKEVYSVPLVLEIGESTTFLFEPKEGGEKAMGKIMFGERTDTYFRGDTMYSETESFSTNGAHKLYGASANKGFVMELPWSSAIISRTEESVYTICTDSFEYELGKLYYGKINVEITEVNGTFQRT